MEDASRGGGPRCTAPAPGFEEEPKTPLERDIAKIREQLENLLLKRAAPVEPNLPSAPQIPLVSNVFVDADLTQVLQDIASTSGATIIPDETVVGIVNATLDNVPLDRALQIILAGTPYVVKKTPYYYLVCSGNPESVMFPVVSETRRIKLNYIPAPAALGLLSTPFQAYVQAEVGRPGADTYTVVVTAPPVLMERIISDLKKIDRVRQQVLLDARIVVMERGDLLNMGVEWGWPTISAGLFSNDLLDRGVGSADFGGKIASGIQIGYTPGATFTNSLTLALNLLAQNDEATILSKPQLLAQDGKVAEINVMTEEYYMMTSQATDFFYTRSELQQIESGTKLSITPHIGDNNDITLEMAVEVSNSIPRGRGSDLPVVTRRTSINTVRIHNGGTVALAGLTENRTRLEKRRTPGLSKLPLVGGLFKSTNDEEASREIAVFVTAYIIPEESRPLDFTQPQTPAIQPPIRSMGGDFKTNLRESLSRSMR